MNEPERSRLSDNIVLFCRILRAAGIALGPARVLEALRAVVSVGVTRRDDLRAALRSALVSNPAEFPLFDRAFYAFFQNADMLRDLIDPVAPSTESAAKVPPPASRRIAEAFGAERSTARCERDANRAGSSSALEHLRDKDFDLMSAAEQRDAAEMLRAGAATFRPLPTRRFRQHGLGSRYDLRRSMRLMVRNHGQLVRLARKQRRYRPPALVLICDVSGSMSRYSRMFLHFAHALTARMPIVHSFVFGTRLTNVSRRLADGDVDAALALVARDVRDFDGGTRIAACLRRFNVQWVRRVSAQNVAVVLLSDGLEREAGTDLEFQMQRLKRSCRQLIWLNPLLRYRDFAPKATGIRLMLPHVDRFVPAHNVRSLTALGQLIFAARRDDRKRPAA